MLSSPAWPRDYIERARPTDVAEMQAAMRLASRDNIDYCDALVLVRAVNNLYQGGRANVTSLPNSGMARTMGENPRSGERAALPVLHGSHPVGPTSPTTGPGGCLLDPPSSDDFMDAGGNSLDYASVSRGW